MYLSRCVFTNNTAGNRGGGSVFVSNVINGLISGCHFDSSTASAGGALSVWKGQLLVLNSSFKGNMAALMGGALYSNGTEVHISHSRLTGNRGPVAGAVFFQGQSESLYITDTEVSGTFENVENHKVTTGTIHVTSPAVQIRNVIFSDNVGGGGLLLNTIRGEILNCSFLRNSGYPAGAVSVIGSTGFVISNTSFVGNKAPSGAALFLSNKRTFVQNCHFESTVGTTAAFEIIITGTTRIDFRSSNNVFHKAPSMVPSNMESVLFLVSQKETVSAALYFWETTYQNENNQVLPIDKQSLLNTSQLNVVKAQNVNWTAEFSQFASGEFLLTTGQVRVVEPTM